MKCPVCGNDLHSEIITNANGITICLFCPTGHFCTDHHVNPENTLHEVLSAYMYNAKKEGNWMSESYIKVSDLLEFCKNQADHSITPNDFMRMNFVTIKESAEPEKATIQDGNRFENLIQGLECCIKICEPGCPYAVLNGGENCIGAECHPALLTDAITMLKAQDEVIQALLKVGYPHNFQREEPWIVNYMYAITDVIRKAVRLKNG